MTQKTVRILLADDHALVRAGIRALLNAMAGVEVVGEASSGEEALEITARQREVLKLVATGKSTKEIAFDLNLSVKTVEAHRAQIMERLGLRDIASLVRYALRTGLVPPDG